MTFDPITQDPPFIDPHFPPDSKTVSLSVDGAHLLAHVLIAQGEGPHPTVAFMHGFPGYERSHDLAQAWRRAGWNVLLFHYRGAWGSQGQYTFSNVLEDAAAALEWLRGDEARTIYRVDGARVVPVGHSLGAWAALMTAARDPQVSAVAGLALFNLGLAAEHATSQLRSTASAEHAAAAVTSFLKRLDLKLNDLLPLRTTRPEALLLEAASHAGDWNLLAQAPRLASRATLLVGASDDRVAPAGVHHDLVARALGAAGTARVSVVTLEADHVFSSRRVELARTVLEWLAGLER